MSLTKNQETTIDELCDRLMRDVVRTMTEIGSPIGNKHVDAACEIMRAEMKEFIAGQAYAEEREAIRLGSIHHGVVWRSVVAGCCTKILAVQKEGR